MSSSRQPFRDLRESVWQLQQSIAHDDYLGQAPDVDQVHRNVGTLALTPIALIDELEEALGA